MAKKKSTNTSDILVKEELEKLTVAELVDIVLEKQTELGTQAVLLEELNQKLADKEIAEKIPGKVVRLKKKTYVVTVNEFSFRGNAYVAADIADDDEIISQLLEIGSPIVKEVTE